jgi:DNA polymerase
VTSRTKGIELANARVAELSSGVVVRRDEARRRSSEWLVAQGVAVRELDKDTMKDLLEDPKITAKVRARCSSCERRPAGRAGEDGQRCSSAMCKDDRVRGTTMYHGAGTGRWTGKLVQPHNFTRGEIDDIEDYIPWMLERDYATLDLLRPPTVVVSSMLRSMITAPPGNMLVAADYSGIEARVLNWLAQQTGHPAALRRREGRLQVQRVAAVGIPLEEVLKFPHRQTGKFQELACGFGMGWKKAISGADTAQYGYLKLTEERAKEIVDNYRETHDKVTAYWAGRNAP